MEVNASFLVIFVQLWNEELLEHVQIHDTGKTFKVVKLFLKHPVFTLIQKPREFGGNLFISYFISVKRK